MTRRHYDPTLRTQPWKVLSVFMPIEQVLARMESSGTIDAAGGVPIFQEDGKGGWYEIVPALQGVIEFHQVALSRYGLPVDIAGLERLCNKLDLGAPIFQNDVDSAHRSIDSCKRQAMHLRVSQASSIVETVRISMELDRLKGKAAQ